MGRGGPGNLDSDAAFEHMSDVCDQIISRIEQTASNDRLMEPDEFESEAMILDIDILIALNAAKLLMTVPDSSDVARWETNYLRVWDEYISSLTNDEAYVRERRKVISDSFDRLLAISIDWHGQQPVTE